MKYLYSIRQKFVEATLNNLGGKSFIWMFHQVNDDKCNWVDPNCAITEKGFRIFLNNKSSFSSIRNINEVDKTNFITFDDAYEDVFFYVYPMFVECKIPFCVFLTVDLIGKENYLKKDQIREMLKSGICTIGSHSLSHPLLRFENNDSSKFEIKHSKELLEDMFGIEIKFFAYPYGSIYACSRKNINMVKDVGYKAAFSTLKGPVSNNVLLKDKYFIPRINVCEHNYLKLLKEYNEF